MVTYTVWPRLYTLPPYSIGWPYIITNPRRKQWALSYLRRHKEKVESIIIDSGVEIFRSGKKDYPGGPMRWFQRMLELRREIGRILGDKEIYIVSPDYPADYPGNTIENNVEKTIRVLEKILELHGSEGIIGVLQGDPIWVDKDLSRFQQHISLYRDLAGQVEYWAVGTLCTLSSIRIWGIPEREAIRWIRRTVETARETIGNRKLHIFGLWLRALPAVKNAIYSFDSQAWTRPVSRRLKRNWSAKNTEEREIYFKAWIRRYLSIVRQKQLL